MIPYIDRDLIRSFLFAFLTIVVLVQVALFVSVLLDFYRVLFGEGESKVGWVLLYYVCSLPRQAAYTLPIGAAVSILWVYVVKARHNELLAWFCGGIGPRRLAMPLLSVCLALSASSFLILEYLAGPAERTAFRIERVNLLGKSVESITRDKNIFQKGGGHRYYNIEEFNAATQTMGNPTIMEMHPDGNTFKWRVDASSAIYKRNEGGRNKGSWTFYNVIVREYDDAGAMTNYRQQAIMEESDLPAPMEENLAEFIKERQRPSQMSVSELLDYIRLLESQKKPTEEMRTYLHEKVVVALSVFVLGLLMCGHVMSPASISVVKGFGGGLLLIVLYFVPMFFFRQVAKGGGIAPEAIYLPSLFFILMGFIMLSRARFAD